MLESTPIVAFDQHAASVTAAVLLPGHRRPATHQLAPDLLTIRRFVKKLQRRGAVRCCYEAGPCGFDLQRALTVDRVCCDVIAPALIPRRAGDRIKTDRRDAAQLAILYRAGVLTPIHIPTAQEEAVRDLLRCREDIRAEPAARPAPPLEIPAAPRSPLHRDQEGLDARARCLAARADLAVPGAPTDPGRLSARHR